MTRYSRTEKFKAEDDAITQKVEAKNQLENFCYSMKNTMNEQFADKISAEDKSMIENTVKETLDWLDSHQDASKEDYENKQKEVESKIQPIFTKMYQQSGAAGGAPQGGFTGSASSGETPKSSGKGPKIEEVD